MRDPEVEMEVAVIQYEVHNLAGNMESLFAMAPQMFTRATHRTLASLRISVDKCLNKMRNNNTEVTHHINL